MVMPNQIRDHAPSPQGQGHSGHVVWVSDDWLLAEILPMILSIWDNDV